MKNKWAREWTKKYVKAKKKLSWPWNRGENLDTGTSRGWRKFESSGLVQKGILVSRQKEVSVKIRIPHSLSICSLQDQDFHYIYVMIQILQRVFLPLEKQTAELIILIKFTYSQCFVAPVFMCFAISFPTNISCSIWQLKHVSQMRVGSDITTGNMAFDTFTSVEKKGFSRDINWACSLNECQDCRQAKAIWTHSVYSGRMPNVWTNQTKACRPKWRKLLIFPGDQTV